MRKTLFLMRHGKAEEGFGKKDFDRELAERGYRDSRLQAVNVFKDELPDHFMVSGSARTRQTVQQIQEVLNFSDERITYDDNLYLASTREIFGSIEKLKDEWQSVCYIGHNPTVIYLSEYLTKSDVGFVKTAGIVKMTWSGSWSEVSEGCATFE